MRAVGKGSHNPLVQLGPPVALMTQSTMVITVRSTLGSAHAHTTLSALLGRLAAISICASTWDVSLPEAMEVAHAECRQANVSSTSTTRRVHSTTAVGRVPRAGRPINRRELRSMSPTEVPLKLLCEARHSPAMASTRRQRLERPSGPLTLHSIRTARCAQPHASPMHVSWQDEDRIP